MANGENQNKETLAGIAKILQKGEEISKRKEDVRNAIASILFTGYNNASRIDMKDGTERYLYYTQCDKGPIYAFDVTPDGYLLVNANTNGFQLPHEKELFIDIPFTKGPLRIYFSIHSLSRH